MSENVIKLMTAPERERAEDEAYKDLCHREALGMLHKRIEIGAARRMLGISIAVVYDDGFITFDTSEHSANTPALMGVTGAAHVDLCHRAFSENSG